MKKVLLILLILLTTFLASCSAKEEDQSFIEFDETISFSYETGSFNNTSSYDVLYGIRDYQKELDMLLYLTTASGDFSKSVPDSELDAYSEFLEKLEKIEIYGIAVFLMDSTELKQLFEANSVEIEALDIFAFNAIKNLFESYEDQTYRISKTEYIELLLERPLTSVETNAFEYLQDILNDVFYLSGKRLPLSSDLENYIDDIESILNRQLDEDGLYKIEITYNILKEIE